MVERTSELAAHVEADLPLAKGHHILVIESPYYADICGLLSAGAAEVFAQHQCTFDRIAVPGALEIPQALAGAVAAGLVCGAPNTTYAGVIALGCVIRGETAHYDIVCNNTNHWTMETVILNRIPFGNGILTVDTHAQALRRAQGGAAGKGGDAARACLRLILLKTQFEHRAGALAHDSR